MNKIIKKVSGNIVQITTADERWYAKEAKIEDIESPEIIWVPSVTWIKSYYYMSPYLVKWIADKGLTESEKIKKEAGLKGDKIHQATEDVDKGLKIKIDAKYLNKENGEMEELTVEEYEAILSYRNYIDDEQPELLANEMTVFAKEDSEEQYAGTLDRIFAIGFVEDKDVRQIYIVDIKSGQSVWKDMSIQLSAYNHADIDYEKLGITKEEWENRKLLIIQVGYRKNKKGYKITEVDDRYDLFKISYQTWKEENPDSKPKQRDFPLFIQSEFRLKENKESKNKAQIEKKGL